MRLRTFSLALMLLAPAALADEQAPDYSRDQLFRLFVAEANRRPVEQDLRFEAGTIEFTRLGTRWKFAWLPFLMPFHGSVRRTNAEFPNPFILTGTSFPQTAHTWRRGRELSREMRRIDRTEKEKRARVRVRTN